MFRFERGVRPQRATTHSCLACGSTKRPQVPEQEAAGMAAHLKARPARRPKAAELMCSADTGDFFVNCYEGIKSFGCERQ